MIFVVIGISPKKIETPIPVGRDKRWPRFSGTARALACYHQFFDVPSDVGPDISVTLAIVQDLVSAEIVPVVKLSVVPNTVGAHQLPDCAFAKVTVMSVKEIGLLVVKPVLPLSTSTTIMARSNCKPGEVTENVTFWPVVTSVIVCKYVPADAEVWTVFMVSVSPGLTAIRLPPPHEPFGFTL